MLQERDVAASDSATEGPENARERTTGRVREQTEKGTATVSLLFLFARSPNLWQGKGSPITNDLDGGSQNDNPRTE
jgi:hypothetical protein